MTGEEEVVQRRKENQERREALKQTEELLRVALARIEEREQQTPVPVHITEHRICKGWVASCQQGKEAPVDLHTSVLGQGRMGGRLASLIATWRTVMRLPMRQLQELLRPLHGVEVRMGAIVEGLHRRVGHAQPVLDDLKTTIRASPAVQADETGWREDGLPWDALTSPITPARGRSSNT